MNAGRLRSLTNQVIACSPVRFELDGRTVECVGWYTNGPKKDADGKPTGIPVLALMLREIQPEEQ